MGRVGDAARRAAGAPKRATVGFWRGFTYSFKGAAFVYGQHFDLIRIWIFPICITLLALCAVTWGAWTWHEGFVAWMWEEPTGEGFWVSVGQVVHPIVEVLALLLLLALGLVVVIVLVPVFAAPFNDALSEEVEYLIGGRKGPPFSLGLLLKDAVRTIGLELTKVALYALVMGPLFLLSLLLPVVGQVVFTIFGFLFTAMYWAIDYVDWPAARRDRGIGHRFGLAKRRFLPMLGFGCGVWLFLFIPLFNLLFMPAAVTGGTMLYLDMETELGLAEPAPAPDGGPAQ